jgi:glycogen synthase
MAGFKINFRSMTILFICNEYPPGKSGGIGSMTRVLARAMAKEGHRILVAGLYAPGYGQKDYEEDEGVMVWRRRYRLDIGLIKNDYSLTDTFLLAALRRTGLLGWDTRKSVMDFNSFIIDLIEKFKIDVVEWPDFNEYFPYLPDSFVWPPLPVPLIVKFNGTASYIARDMKEKINPATLRQEKRHIERADLLVSVSRYTADSYTSLYGNSRPVEILYNSIDLPAKLYRPADVTPTIVFTGTLTRRKGIYSLLKAWNLVNPVHPEARLRIFGKGKVHLFESLLDTKARGSVVFEGFASRDQLYAAFSTAAAAIFPSYNEAFANAPLEAMAIGCPVIYSTRASGPELIRPGENGLLIDPDDPRQIADAIIELLENDRLRNGFSIKGRQTIEERFDTRRSVNDHIQLYQKQLSKHMTNT